MTEFIILLVSALPLPILMLIIGFISWKNPPAPGAVGYKTKRSKSSVEAWYFAQVTWGKLMVFYNIPLLLATAASILAALLLKFSENDMYIVTMILPAIQIVVIFWVLFKTELRLKKNYNADGTHK